MTTRLQVLVAIGLLAGGCATVPPSAEPGVAEAFRRRTGTPLYPAVGAADHAIDRFLARPLTPDAAVRIALLNNRRVRATMAQLNIAEADLAQAGLLTNPTFDLEVKFHEGGGGSTIEGAVAQNLLEVFVLPMRKRLAAAEFAVARESVLLSLLDIVRDARVALVEAQAAQQQSTLRRQLLEAAELRAEFARHVHEAGNITDLALALIESDAEQARLDVVTARDAELSARERLNIALGLFGARTSWTTGDVAIAPARAGDDFEAEVVRASVELARDRAALAAGARSLAFRRTFSWSDDLEAGAAFEKEPSGEWSLGPSVGGAIPLWDLGGPRVARAQATYEQAQATYYAHAVDVRAAARLARDRLTLARSQADRIANVTVPLQQRIGQLSLLHYNAMQIDAMALLNVRRSTLATLSQAIDTQRRAALAAAEVQHLRAGGRATMSSGGSDTGVASAPSASGDRH